jgi:subtilisin family serine protease
MLRAASGFSTATLILAMASTRALGASPVESDRALQAARVDGGRVGVMIELTGEPTARTYARILSSTPAVRALGADVTAQATVAAQQQLAQVEAAQKSLLPALTGAEIGAEVIYRVQRVYNGIAVYVDPARVDAIRRLPGVKAVHPLVPDRMLLTTSVPWIGAPQVWQGIGNVTGTGVSIGIIDSGIDYLHKDFGGSGVYTGQNFADNTVPWNAKVVGGHDFAGDAYTGSNTPHPDGDPMDLESVGHGTHVAGIAAGYGVTSEGDTYAGPWAPGVDYSLFSVGPGVAPGAKLYAIRVFGSGLSTGLSTQGIEWALDPNGDGNLSDHLDVINLSLGSPFGSSESQTVTAVENAAAAGVIVVAAAGNEGDTTYVVSAPGVAPRAISVAASADAGVRASDLHITSPAEIAGNPDSTPAAFGGATSESGLSGPVVLVTPNNACTAITNGAEIAGNIALIDRGICTFVSKVKAAQNAGAIGVIVVDNKGEFPFTMVGKDDTITIPALLTSGAGGDRIKSKLPTPGVQATLMLLSDGGTVAYFSSRGPRESQDALKPDITAPGYVITSAAARGGTTAANFGGTSMATPHVAGAMALLKQLHSDWSPQALKALVMNTATDLYANFNQQGPLMSPMRVGAGELYMPTAAASSSIAYDADHPDLVSLCFGAFEVSGTTTLTRTIKVENRGTGDQTFAVGYTATSDVAGVDITFPGGSSVTAPAGGSSTFTVQLNATASAMNHGTDPAADTTQDERPRQLLGEEAGFVTLTPAVGTALRVPLYAAPRPAGAMGTHESELILGAAAGTLTVNLAGQGLESGAAYPADIVSLVTPLELQYAGPATAPPVTANASIRYVGVGSDFAAGGGGSLAATTLEFGIATVGDWATPSDVGFEVDVDINRDGAYDYQLETTDSSTVTDNSATPSDVFGVKLCPSGAACTWIGYVNRYSAAELDTVVFGTNVVVLPVPASALGLSSGASAFDYRVKSTNSSAGSVSTTAKMTYDVAKPGLAPLAGSFGPVAARSDGQVQLAYDRANYAADAAQGLLLLHHHNTSGARAQVLPVGISDCSLSCSAIGPEQALAATGVSFSASTATAGCSPAVTFDWDFGDGTAHGSGAATSHTYANAGAFGWRVTSSAAGMTCVQSGSITVKPPVPARPVHRRPLRATT